ncbi:MAG: acyltransferase domain-containing protein [Ruminococcus flavefaciens]|nr:acyltransferase domain-containing protein [Ruminococcus flavefaciens]
MKEIYDVKDTDIAVIGYSCRFPEADSVEHFWENLKDGKDCITRQDKHEDGKTFAFGKIDDMYSFEPEFFGLTESSAKIMDPHQRLMFKLCAETLETAGYSGKRESERIGLFCSSFDFMYVWKGYFLIPAESAEELMLRKTYLDGSFASRIGYHMNFTGPCMPVKASCASSLYAIHEAVLSILNDECDMAVAGGVNLIEEQDWYSNAENTLSVSGVTRPFAKDADGFVPGNGGGAVLLKRLSDCLRDGDVVHAVIKGSAINNDGFDKISYTAPSVKGETDALSDALSVAGIEPDDIGYIEAHGTATALGDTIEISAIQKVYGNRENDNPLYIGSVKSNVGHLNYSAGVSGFIKTVLMLEKGIIPPSLHCDALNDELHMNEYGYIVPSKNIVWNSGIRYAGVSGFGVGGNNCHIVLSSAPKLVKDNYKKKEFSSIVVTGRSKEALRKNCNSIAEFIEKNPDIDLSDIGFTLNRFRKKERFRVGFGSDDSVKLAKTMKAPFRAVDADSVKDKTIVWLFPGSNVFSTADIAELYKADNKLRELLDDVFRIVLNECGVDLKKCISGTEETDEYSISLLSVCVQCALGEYLRDLGVKCDAVLGHSAGEYLSAYFAGAISKQTLIKLYSRRNRLFEKLPEGKMASVYGRPDDFEFPDGVSVSAVNTPSRFMIAGESDKVSAYLAELEKEQVFCTELPLKRAGHCCLVDGILPEFDCLLNDISFTEPKIRFISSALGKEACSEITSKDYWIKQLRSPVRFADSVSVIDKMENVLCIEIGFGEQLSYFVKKTVKSRKNKEFVSIIPEDISDKGSAFFTGLAMLDTLDAVSLSYSGHKIYLPPAAFVEKVYNETEERESKFTVSSSKSWVLDGNNEKMSELMAYLKEQGEVKAVQYLPEQAFDNDNTALYNDFRNIELSILESSDFRCIKEVSGLSEAFDLLCFTASADYFKSYSCFIKEKSTVTWGGLCEKIKVISEYRPFVMLMLDYLRKFGYVNFEKIPQNLEYQDIIVCEKSISGCETMNEVKEKVKLSHSEYSAFTEFFAKCASRYGDVFEGMILGKEILYPEGSYQQLFDVYKNIPAMNKVTLYSEIFSKMLEKLTENSRRPLKVLEIGAGTGLVTWNAVPVIEKSGGSYWFSDIGTSFIKKARKRSSENNYKCMEFCYIDVTKDFYSQGVPEDYFDVIVSCNVIQATNDMINALEQCRKALRSGGMIALIQTVDGHHTSEMLYGLCPEWWNYQQDSLRKYSPVLDSEQFCKVLSESGFVDTVHFDGSENLLTDTALLFGRKKNDRVLYQNEKAPALAIAGYEKKYVSEFAEESKSQGVRFTVPENWKKRCLDVETKTSVNSICRNSIDSELCEIIRNITGIEIDNLETSIYSYDIDSLCGLMICSQIKNKFRVDFSVKDMLGCTNIREISDLIEERK